MFIKCFIISLRNVYKIILKDIKNMSIIKSYFLIKKCLFTRWDGGCPFYQKRAL